MSDKDKSKILHVVEAMGGGVFTYIVELVNELVNEYDVYLAYAVRPQTPENYSDYFDKRVHLIKVSNFCKDIKPAREIAAVKELRQISDTIRPDIIHMHSSKAGVIGRIAFRSAKVPLFYTPHGYSFLMKDIGKLKRTIYWGIEKWFSLYNCTVISCSYGEHLETLKLTKKALYVNNAINCEMLKNKITEAKRYEHPFTVFTIGRICSQKNPAFFNAIAEAVPDAKFLWIGDGEMRDQLKSNNIEITGWLNRENVIQTGVNADMFILTSLWEGLPISLLEAMYMRKPCAVSNVIGNRDVIRNGVNGYVCDSVDDFVAAINERKPECVERAYCDVTEKYDTKKQAMQYSEIYRRRMENRG